MATYTGSVTITNINDGADANSYVLSSNIQGFQKYYELDENGNGIIILSDNFIDFKLEQSINEEQIEISPENYYTDLLILDDDIYFVEYGAESEADWREKYNAGILYIKVNNEYKQVVDPVYDETQTYFIDLSNSVRDLWDLFEHINVDNNTSTLLDKVYSEDLEKNIIRFNLYNSIFYTVEENLNSDYYMILKSYRNFMQTQNAYFMIEAYNDEQKTQFLNYSLFFVEYAVSDSFAKFALTANSIQASVDNSVMVFDGSGLIIYDGGLSIKQSDYYMLTTDTERSKYYQVWRYDENQWEYNEFWRTLYIKNNDEYILNTNNEYDENIIYYQGFNKRYFIYNNEYKQYIEYEGNDLAGKYELVPESDLLQYDIDNKRLNIKGSGEFTGTVYATDGVFSGTIVATTGEIGGFTISNNALISESKSKTLDKTPIGDKKYYELINGEYTIVDLPKQVSLDQVRQPKKDYYIQELLENQEVRYVLYEGYYKLTSDLIRQEGKIYYIKIDDEYIEYEGELEQGVNYYEFDTSLQSGVTYYEDYFQSQHTYYDDPSIQLIGRDENGQNGKIIAQNIDLGIGANITNYIKLGNAFIYNPLNNNNNFIDIQNSAEESIINFRADGTGHIGDIYINGNEGRLNGKNWWISPNKASFSNIDVTGTIHTSVFETGKIQSVGGSMFFKESARVKEVRKQGGQFLFILETNMQLNPGSIVLCITDDSNYTDTSLTDDSNFYGRVVSSSINKSYQPKPNNEPFYDNITYYTYDSENNKYTKFIGDNFEVGVIYYILYEDEQQVVIELDSDSTAAKYAPLTNQIIQLGDNIFIETEDQIRQQNKNYYIYNVITNNFELYEDNFEQGVTYYEKTNNYTNNLVIGVNATNHYNKMLYPEGFTFIKFDNIENNKPLYNDTPILFLGNLESLNNENMSGYGLYGENVFLTGSLTTKNENIYSGINTLSNVAANVFTREYFPDEPELDTSKIVFWAGAKSTLPIDIQASPFQVTEKGSFYANHGLFKGSIFVDATIEASQLRTASIYGTGDITSDPPEPALKIYDTNTARSGIHFYWDSNGADIETLRLTNLGFSADEGVTYFVDLDNNSVNFNGNIFTGQEYCTTLNDNNQYFKIQGTDILAFFKQSISDQDGLEQRFIHFQFDNDKTRRYKISCGDEGYIEQDSKSGLLDLYSTQVQVEKEFILGKKIKYTQSTDNQSNLIGYDMYVH